MARRVSVNAAPHPRPNPASSVFSEDDQIANSWFCGVLDAYRKTVENDREGSPRMAKAAE